MNVKIVFVEGKDKASVIGKVATALVVDGMFFNLDRFDSDPPDDNYRLKRWNKLKELQNFFEEGEK